MWDSDTLPLILSLSNMFNYVSQLRPQNVKFLHFNACNFYSFKQYYLL